MSGDVPPQLVKDAQTRAAALVKRRRCLWAGCLLVLLVSVARFSRVVFESAFWRVPRDVRLQGG